MTVASLARRGIQRRPLRALTSALVTAHLRSQHFARATGSKPGELVPPLFWVVGQYVLVSALVSLALFMRVDAWAFAFVGLSCSTLLMASGLAVELHEVVLGPSDAMVVGHRPVAASTYAAARLANLGFYVALLTAAANVFPAVLGSALRDAGAAFLPAYLAAAVMLNLATTAVFVILSGSSKGDEEGGLRDVLAWTQIVLVLVAFYGAQLMLRDDLHRIERFLAAPPDWVAWIPSAYLAELVARASRGRLAPGAALTAATACGLLVTVALLRLAEMYRRTLAGVAGQPRAERSRTPRVRRLVAGPARWLGRTRPQRAFTALAQGLLRRDADLRLRLLPALALPIAAAAMGLATGQLASPFAGPGTASRGALSLVAIQLVVLAVPSMLHSMSLSRYADASWVLAVSPRPRAAGAVAAHVAVCYGVALPVLLLVGAALVWSWRDAWQVAVIVAIGWLEVLAASWATLARLRFDLPFSRPPALGESGALAPWLAVVGLGAAAVATLETWIFPRGPALALVAAVLALLAWRLRARVEGAR